MKKLKIETFIKDNLKSFIIGGLIFSIIGVYAAITFSSNEVSYDNSASGLSSTTLKGAIDELYKKCTKKPAGEQIIEDVDIVTSGDGLYEDEYEEDRYIYKGTTPNNYIIFNNETWRIISIESDNTLKIMRNEPVTEMNWKDDAVYTWATSKINNYLNGEYINSIKNNEEYISSHIWHVGSVTYDNNNLKEQIENENSLSWTGNIGLMTLSEYLRANSNTQECKTFKLTNGTRECENTNWIALNIKDSSSAWTITSRPPNSNGVYACWSNSRIYDGNNVDSYMANINVYPALHLSSSVQITGGNGSQSNPYTLSVITDNTQSNKTK